MTAAERRENVAHRAERTYEVPADPEQVWQVIATAEGISSWMAPTELDPRVGGAVAFDLDEVTSTGVVTAFTPYEHFAYEEPWPVGTRPEELPPGMAQWFASLGIPLADVYATLPDVSPIATEFLIESASGGSTVLRVVTSAYGTGAEWENEFFDQMVASLAPFFDALELRLWSAAS